MAMQYSRSRKHLGCLVGMGLLLLACADKPKIEVVPNSAPIVVTLDSLSPLAQTVLRAQQQSYQQVLTWLDAGELPTCIQAEDWATDHLSAVLGGSEHLLHPHYRRIYNISQRPSRHVDLSFQQLSYLPDRVCRSPDLRYLSLSNNQLKALNPLLAQCAQLRKLDLSSNGFKHLPEGVLQLAQVHELILSDNLLASLPLSFARLHSLRILDIGNLHPSTAQHHNQVQHFPSVLLQMPLLEKLFLGKLPLRHLPNTLYRMEGLRVLSLNGNRAMQWNSAFQILGRMPQLLALDISFIGRRRLPESIRQLQNLKILIWHEENQGNKEFVETTLRQWLPNTKIYYGKKGVATPFLRGNSIKTIEKIAEG